MGIRGILNHRTNGTWHNTNGTYETDGLHDHLAWDQEIVVSHNVTIKAASYKPHTRSYSAPATVMAIKCHKGNVDCGTPWELEND